MADGDEENVPGIDSKIGSPKKPQQYDQSNNRSMTDRQEPAAMAANETEFIRLIIMLILDV